MRHTPKVLIALALLVCVGASRAEAVTVRDLVELSKAGLSDQVLLALIEVDRSVFTIDAPTLKMLKDAGVSEAVIVAMIRSGRTAPPVSLDEQPIEPPPPFVAPEPQVVVIEHEVPVVREVPVAVPRLHHRTADWAASAECRRRSRRRQSQPPGTQILRAIRVLGLRRQASPRCLRAAERVSVTAVSHDTARRESARSTLDS